MLGRACVVEDISHLAGTPLPSGLFLGKMSSLALASLARASAWVPSDAADAGLKGASDACPRGASASRSLHSWAAFTCGCL